MIAPWQGRIQVFLKGVQGSRKGRSVGIFKLTNQKTSEGDLNPLNYPLDPQLPDIFFAILFQKPLYIVLIQQVNVSPMTF